MADGSVEKALVRPCDLPAIRRGVEIQRVKMRHRRVVALHLSGHSNAEVDAFMGKRPGYAAGVLRQPKVREILARAYEEFDLHLKTLIPKAIHTLDKNMTCGDPAVEVRAATEALKVNGKYDRPDQGQVTAEEVVEELWDRYEEANGASVVRRKTVRRRLLTNVGGLIGEASPSSSD